MDKRIISVLLLLVVVSMASVPDASARIAKQFMPFQTPVVTETQIIPTPVVTHVTPHITPTPVVTQTSVPVPEYPSLAVPVAGVMGLMMLLLYRRRK